MASLPHKKKKKEGREFVGFSPQPIGEGHTLCKREKPERKKKEEARHTY